ncbi:MAG: phosphoribosylanthranilate isomerase [Cycloclasticus sp.]|nr:MAG: phosphoribosylanthranilate isomerase [Cycloclasticus sp.]
MRTRVKICGITQTNDALAAIEAGADALGFVFYDKSPRYLDILKAKKIFNEITPFINKIALFVNPSYEYVMEAVNTLPIDVLQFHGDEDEAFCKSFNTPYLKAVRIRPTTDLKDVASQYGSASGLLIDAYDSTQYGGTGQTFDWNLLPQDASLPLILAGGLNSQNVYDAIKQTNPYAVDVSSGVEKSKGVKEHSLIQQFMQEVKRADQ